MGGEKMRIRKSLVFGMVLGVLVVAATIAANAQAPETIDIRTVARPATDAENTFVQAAIGSPEKISGSGFRTQGLETDFSFPPFVGAALEIIPVPNFSAERTVYATIAGLTISGCLAARVTFPSGDSTGLNSLCLSQPLDLRDSNYRFSIWKGELPRSGVTTFQVFNVDLSGRVSDVSASTAYATNFSGERLFIGPIGLSSDGSVIVNGTFDTIAVAGTMIRNLGFISGAVIAKPPYLFPPGDYTVTGCLRGVCATRILSVGSDFRGGRGGVPGDGSAAQ